MRPLLVLHADGLEKVQAELRAALAVEFGVTADELEERIPSGTANTFVNRVAWASTHLSQAALIVKPRRGISVITDRGHAVLDAHPDRVDMAVLQRFGEYVDFRTRRRSTGPIVDDIAAEAEGEAVPPRAESEIANAYRCDTCGWVYLPGEHDGLALADHENWECPDCQAGIDHFELVVPDEIGEPDDDSDVSPGDFDIPLAERKVSAQRADNSVFELHRQEQRGLLRLQPIFQRYYVWTEKQASALVESLFLRLPIPVIYLAEEKTGEHSVIDGQQRLTALFKFMDGEYPISGLEVLKDLNGKHFSDLNRQQQAYLEGFLLSVVRIDKDSHPEIKFEVFERLNTGSVKLNDQEVRNAVFRGPFNDHLRALAKNSTFLRMLGQTEPHRRMSDVELVLRFSAFLNQTYLNFPRGKLKAFLNKEAENGRAYSERKLMEVEKQFKKSVDLASTVFGNKSFRRFTPGHDQDHNGQWETRQVNKALYDVIMYGFTRYSKNQVVPHAERMSRSPWNFVAAVPV